MNLKLVKASYENQALITEMMDEWTKTGEKIVPYAIRKADYRDYDAYLQSLER